ncbi:hypothetical protein M9H77_07619 [Catharanthus roseus]|uniref:Uncharacterized protein n=1 Tax=Catharanthus roseus TaxID=4058 RepID=A0ACC0BVF8_CATRO|nr:hypothetical protein M9H77_07619 [Catharanthus roseus]
MHKDRRYRGYGPFVLAHQAEQVSFLPYTGSKTLWTDWVSMVKSGPCLIHVPHQDDAFQENVDIHNSSALYVMIEDVRLLVHESRLSEELDMAVETYFEEVKMMKPKYNGILRKKIPIKTPMKRSTRISMRILTYRTLHDYVLLYLCYSTCVIIIIGFIN